jgi:signal transduction histidine kinase
MRLHVAAGYRSAQSTPLVTRAGKAIGMVSTHWREPGHRPEERQLHFLDLLARQAADLLERAVAEDTLRRSEMQLKEADRRKDEFIAMLAHELRNPLAPVRAGLEVIRLVGESDGPIARVRTIMERQVGHMVRLVDDLLDVSRITSGKIRLQREPMALHDLIHSAVEANRAAIAAADLELEVDLPEQACVVDVDATRFVQVVSNLLHNATKFTPPGGSIVVQGRVREAEGEEPQLALSVLDSGIGIPEEMLAHVFDLFVQGEGVSSHPGLGIGLALARRLIEMHGGTVDAQSDGPGRGSRFIVRLPLVKAALPLP